MARDLKFRIKEVERLYYLCSENKGADQLRGYREADLRLCFRICKKPVFSRRGSNHQSQSFILLINVKMPKVIEILAFTSRIDFLLILVEHQKTRTSLTVSSKPMFRVEMHTFT